MIPADQISKLEQEGRVHDGSLVEGVEDGELLVLSVHRGDMKLRFNSQDPKEVEEARAAIQDMLKRGYMVFIDMSDDHSGDALQRVQAFDPTHDEYVIRIDKRSKLYKDAVDAGETPPKEQRVPAKKTRATAVAPASGG